MTLTLPRSLGACLAAAACLLAAVPIRAKVATPDWTSLFASADAIALLRVDRIEQHAGVPTAVATVLEPVRGLKPGTQVAYVAAPGWFWTCDDSYARVGETALLLLAPIAKQRYLRDTKPLEAAVTKRYGGRMPLFAIAWSGWGRLQARRRCGQWRIMEPPYRNPPAEFKRQRKAGSVPLTAVRQFAVRATRQARR